MQITDEEYLELLELEKERDSLKQENAELRKWKEEDPRMLREQIRVADEAYQHLFERHKATEARLKQIQEEKQAEADSCLSYCTELERESKNRGGEVAETPDTIKAFSNGQWEAAHNLRYGIAALTEERDSLRQQVERLTMERDEAKEGEAYADKCLCELWDKLGSRGKIEEHESAIERLRDLIAAEGEVGDLRATVERMREALKPFADVADSMEGLWWPDALQLWGYSDKLSITAGHCRAARKAMEIYETKTPHNESE